MNFFKIKTTDQVEDILRRIAIDRKVESEIVPLALSRGRISTVNIKARNPVPGFDRSTVDGYAVLSRDVTGAGESIPSILTFQGEVAMGETTDLVIRTGETAYVPTGGMIPEGADAMVMIENSMEMDSTTILIYKPAAPGDYITYTGDDLKEDEIIIEKGRIITPYYIGLLAGLGINEIEIQKRPRLAIISTGDEIKDIDEVCSPGQIFDMNGYALEAAASQAGFEPVFKRIVPDDKALLCQTLAEAAAGAEIILLSGGSSVGTRDFTDDAIESLPNSCIHVHGVAVKPGKPTIIGTSGRNIIFGLPGHPVSALVIFHIFVRFLFKELTGLKDKDQTIPARITQNIHAAPGKETFQMVRLEQKDNRWTAVPLYAKSGIMSLLAAASGYIRISSDKEGLFNDESIQVYPLKEGFL